MQLAELFRTGEFNPLPTPHWPSVIPAASAQFVLPSISKRVKTLRLTPGPEIHAVLETAETLNRERNQLLLAEAAHVASLLNRIGIEPVALKGLAYLLAGVYPDPAERYLEDIDLLIRSEQINSAVECLRENGFAVHDSDVLTPFRHHSPGMCRPGRPPIELHHALGPAVCRKLLPAEQVFREAVGISFQSARFLIPSPEHLAAHLIFHSQLIHSYRDRIFPPLRALYDLDRLNEALHPSWPAVANRFKRSGEYWTLALHLKQAESLLGIKSPIPSQLTWIAKIRMARRCALNRKPWLRFFDPMYLFMCLLSRRFRIVKQLADHPRYWRHLVKAIFRVEYYRRLLRV